MKKEILDSDNFTEQKNIRKKNIKDKKGLFVKAVFVLLILFSAISIYVVANNYFANNTTATSLRIFNNSNKIEILDGANNKKAILFLIDTIRTLGGDVVEMKRNKEGNVEKSYIFDRSNKTEEVKLLAKFIGISESKVFLKTDKSSFVDITIVLGEDYKQLTIFKKFVERNNR